MLVILRRIKQTILHTLALYFSAVTTPVLAQAAIIDAIMGGGMVKGTECVNGKVDPEAISKQNDAMSYGPDQTLYVANGAAVNLRSADDYAFSAGDEVFSRVIGGGKEGDPLPYTCQLGNTSIGSFASSSSCSGGSLPFGSGEGSHELVFLTKTGTEVVLGRLYKTTPNVSGGVTESYSCSPPGLLPPDKPQMRGAAPHASGGMLVEFDQTGPGGDPDYYLYEMQHEGDIQNRDGRVVDEQGNDDTSSPFVITPEAALSLTPGQWKVRIQALNAAGGSPWSDYSDLMSPSVEEPPIPDAPFITGVTTGNGSATINFNAPNDNGVAITNHAYRLTGEFDDPGDFITLDPPIVGSPLTLAGLVNGKTYTVSIAAINANGMGPDSNEEEFTVGTQCEDVTDWTAPANTMGYFCSVGLNDYAYADFHILTSNGPDVCAERETYLLPTEDNDKGLFCAQEGNTVRAIYDWNNSREVQLKWLKAVGQIGSRSGSACGNAGSTLAVRCANQLASGYHAFYYMAGAGGSGIDGLDITNLKTLERMFSLTDAFNRDIGGWDTSNAESMEWMFYRARAFNQYIGDWDTSKVTKMDQMFDAAPVFNQDISTKEVTRDDRSYIAWDTSSVTNMAKMFGEASAFDQDIGDWDTSNVERMERMFYRARAFNQNIGNWDTSSVTHMDGVFEGASAFDQDIGDWDTSKVIDMYGMFNGATAFNQNINTKVISPGEADEYTAWDTSSVMYMDGVFKGASAFNQDLSEWNVDAVTDHDDFDNGADAWCGLGFENQGRPGELEDRSTARNCQLNLDVTTEPQEVVATGSPVLYTAKLQQRLYL